MTSVDIAALARTVSPTGARALRDIVRFNDPDGVAPGAVHAAARDALLSRDLVVLIEGRLRISDLGRQVLAHIDGPPRYTGTDDAPLGIGGGLVGGASLDELDDRYDQLSPGSHGEA